MAKKTQEPVLSTAMKLIKHIWDNSMQGTGHSWERLNHSMYQAVCLAIHVGLVFDDSDFPYMEEHMRLYRWAGSTMGEGWYCQAINVNNASAIAAYESWRGRKPFLLQTDDQKTSRERLRIKSQFWWKGHFVVVTSFSDEQSYFVACSYKDDRKLTKCKKCGQTKYASFRSKVAKRFKITHDDIKQHHTELRAFKKAEEEKKKAKHK